MFIVKTSPLFSLPTIPSDGCGSEVLECSEHTSQLVVHVKHEYKMQLRRHFFSCSHPWTLNSLQIDTYLLPGVSWKDLVFYLGPSSAEPTSTFQTVNYDSTQNRTPSLRVWNREVHGSNPGAGAGAGRSPCKAEVKRVYREF